MSEKEKDEKETTEQTKETEKEETDSTGFEGYDYSGVISDDDMIEIEGEKMKFADIKNFIKEAKTKKENKETNKEDEEPKENEKVAKNTNSEIDELDEDEKIVVMLLKREYNREWERIKDKYPLVDWEDVRIKLLNQKEKDPSQVEPVAKKLQEYFEKKVEEKEKKRKEILNKAKATNMAEGESPTPTSSKEDDEFIDINDTAKIAQMIKKAISPK